MTLQATRAMLYRAFRRRGHPAMACLRVAYGPRVRPTGEQPALDAMRPDLGDVLHECMCPGCDACIRDALRIIVIDQTFGVGIGPEGEEWVLLVRWRAPFGRLSADACLDLVTWWLTDARWRPDDGGERAAKICWAASDAAHCKHTRREEIRSPGGVPGDWDDVLRLK